MPSVRCATLAVPGPDDPLALDELPFARKVGGTVGVITTAVCVESNFAYCAISRYITPERLTRRIVCLLLRIAQYLASTISLHLHIAVPAREVAPDGNGAGYGGFILMTKQRLLLPPTAPSHGSASSHQKVSTALGSRTPHRFHSPQIRDRGSHAAD